MPGLYLMHMADYAVEAGLLASDDTVPFNDRPYFRRLLDFDDLVRRGRPVTCEFLAERWETSSKTVQRFVDQIRTELAEKGVAIEDSKDGVRWKRK